MRQACGDLGKNVARVENAVDVKTCHQRVAGDIQIRQRLAVGELAGLDEIDNLLRLQCTVFFCQLFQPLLLNLRHSLLYFFHIQIVIGLQQGASCVQINILRRAVGARNDKAGQRNKRKHSETDDDQKESFQKNNLRTGEHLYYITI